MNSACPVRREGELALSLPLSAAPLERWGKSLPTPLDAYGRGGGRKTRWKYGALFCGRKGSDTKLGHWGLELVYKF